MLLRIALPIEYHIFIFSFFISIPSSHGPTVLMEIYLVANDKISRMVRQHVIIMRPLNHVNAMLDISIYLIFFYMWKKFTYLNI